MSKVYFRTTSKDDIFFGYLAGGKVGRVFVLNGERWTVKPVGRFDLERRFKGHKEINRAAFDGWINRVVGFNVCGLTPSDWGGKWHPPQTFKPSDTGDGR